MSRLFAALFVVASVAAWAHAQQPNQGGQIPPGGQPGGTAPAPQDLRQKASYTFGYNIGRSMRSEGIDIDINMLVRGLQQALADQPAALTDEEMQTVITEFSQQVAAKAGQKNKEEGEQFLANNAKQPGVTSLPSGLQYKVLKSGQGKSPTLNNNVVAHYRGTTLDGNEFDSSYRRGEPATFPLNRVIKGWQEALQKMKVGDQWELYIPPGLAYGEEGTPGIAPNSVLVFQVELLEVQ